MVSEGPLKDATRRILREIREYSRRWWHAEDRSRILVHLEPEWGRLHIVLALDALPKGRSADELWFDLKDYLSGVFREEPEIAGCYSLRIEEDTADNPFLNYVANRFDVADNYLAIGPAS